MGEMADLMIEQMERGESLIRNKITGKEFWVANTDLMYGNYYPLSDYEIIEDSPD